MHISPLLCLAQMAQVMKENSDTTLYGDFEQACVNSYNIVREHGFLFLTYFVAMLPAGLPELASDTDINYLREKLAVEVWRRRVEWCCVYMTVVVL